MKIPTFFREVKDQYLTAPEKQNNQIINLMILIKEKILLNIIKNL